MPPVSEGDGAGTSGSGQTAEVQEAEEEERLDDDDDEFDFPMPEFDGQVRKPGFCFESVESKWFFFAGKCGNPEGNSAVVLRNCNAVVQGPENHEEGVKH